MNEPGNLLERLPFSSEWRAQCRQELWPEWIPIAALGHAVSLRQKDRQTSSYRRGQRLQKRPNGDELPSQIQCLHRGPRRHLALACPEAVNKRIARHISELIARQRRPRRHPNCSRMPLKRLVGFGRGSMLGLAHPHSETREARALYPLEGSELQRSGPCRTWDRKPSLVESLEEDCRCFRNCFKKHTILQIV
jgi:hypothetical protein